MRACRSFAIIAVAALLLASCATIPLKPADISLNDLPQPFLEFSITGSMKNVNAPAMTLFLTQLFGQQTVFIPNEEGLVYTREFKDVKMSEFLTELLRLGEIRISGRALRL